MAIETWDSPYIVIWLCFGILVTVLTFGVQGYNDKVSSWGACGYSVVIGGLSILNGAVLGQVMYDKSIKYDVLGILGNTLGLSGSLLISGFILLVFYRFRVVKNPKEVVVIGGELEISGCYLLSGMSTFLWFGLMLLGIGMGNVVVGIVGDRKGAIYALYMFMPAIIAIWLMIKYRKWIFKYIVWVLRRKGLLQVIDGKSPE